jgi:ELWxxDGT repeat protein
MGSTLFFRADDGTNGTELWKSDGTTAGTSMVKDIHPTSSSNPYQLTVVGSTLFFEAYDDINGTELWKSDGTTAGTSMVKDIRTGASSSYPSALTAAGNILFFSANDGNGSTLWSSAGTAAWTLKIGIQEKIRDDSSCTQEFAEMGTSSTSPAFFFFSADGGTTGCELWKSDGTTAGTSMVKDIRPGTSGSYPYQLTVVGSTLFFRATDDINGYELWKSDGTTAGTSMVKDINPTGSSYPWQLTVVGSILYFIADNSLHGYELWKSDGTTAGTTLVNDLTPGADDAYVGDMFVFDSNLYLVVWSSGDDFSMYVWHASSSSMTLVDDSILLDEDDGWIIHTLSGMIYIDGCVEGGENSNPHMCIIRPNPYEIT